MKDVLFVDPRNGFTVNYLKYDLALEFRAYAPARAQDGYENVFGHPVSDDRSRKLYANAFTYWLTSTELYSIP